MTEEELIRKSRRLLDESLESMDGATLSRLHQVRSAAIERSRRREPKWFEWTSMGAVCTGLAVIAFNVYIQPPPLPTIYQDPQQQATAEQMELLDDLDFIAWLVMEEDGFEDVGKSS